MVLPLAHPRVGLLQTAELTIQYFKKGLCLPFLDHLLVDNIATYVRIDRLLAEWETLEAGALVKGRSFTYIEY